MQKDYTFLEHDYTKREGWCTSEYIDEIVKHIAGFIVFSLKKKIHCHQCLSMLQKKDNVSTNSKLTELKNRGSLHFSSDDVNYICLTAEKVFRQNKHLIFSSTFLHIIFQETLEKIPTTILDRDEYSAEQDLLCDHRHQLILSILNKYFDIRMHHEGSTLRNHYLMKKPLIE